MKYNVMFYGNLYNCPAGKRLPDCPVLKLDHLNFQEKVDWFDQLPHEEKKRMVTYHNKCLMNR